MSGDRPSGRWVEVPRRSDEGSDRVQSAFTFGVVALIVGPLGPFVRTLMIAPSPSPVIVAVAGIVGLIALRATSTNAWWVRFGVAAVAAAVVAPSGGRWTGIWMLPALLLAAWLVMDRRPAPRCPPLSPDLRAPLMAIALGGTWVGRQAEATWAPLLVFGGSTVIVVTHAVLGDRLGRATKLVTQHVERGLAMALMAPVWVLTTLLPWSLQRLMGVDPLQAPLSRSRTVALRRLTNSPSRLWEKDRARDRLPLTTRFRRSLAIPLGLSLIAVATVSWVSLSAPTEPIPAAGAAYGWWPEHADVVSWYVEDGFDPVRYRRQRDIKSPTINVIGGERVSWEPPACQCPELEVWMYGGSTTFGLGQRDDHTIPSELARLAFADGLSMRVVNRGVIGDTHWAESLRFTWDSEVEPQPDLVIFFDGYNELLSSWSLNETGEAERAAPLDQTLEAALRDRPTDGGDALREGPAGALLFEPAPGKELDPPALGLSAVDHYSQSLSVSTATALHNRTPAFWFWQPTRVARDDPADMPEGVSRSDAEEIANRQAAEAARSHLPEQVVDLSDSLDDAGGPLFYDDVHINERGAKLLAAKLYDQLRPTILIVSSS